ncbi:MAG: hypothetical protein HPY83_12435 [Anaerolineae bacterium]|nr:hypothetical protein [Anaerolineae bacterium]
MMRRLARPALVLMGLLALLFLAAAVGFRLLDQTNGSLVSSGQERTYLLYVPDSYDPATPTSLVITIHGFAQWPAHQMQLSRWNALADQHGFIVVYPSGTGFPRRWRAGGVSAAGDDPQVDVRFVSDLIAHLESKYNIAPDRIYVNGLSNGGGMSFLLACALSERIAAVGMVAGAYVLPWEECNPARPVPAIVFHGTDDPIVPFDGGPSRPFGSPFPNVPEWVETLARRNGCNGPPRELSISDEVTGRQFTDCEADVVFYVIAGGGHTWPGGIALPELIANRTTYDIDATQTMWEFFQEHPLPGR